MIHVTFDHLDGVPMDERIEAAPQYAIERILGLSDEIPNDGPTVPFRLYDDDGELYYSGVLTDDDEGENQSAAYDWGAAMAGCAIIKVKRDGRWVQEIA